jgi:hypothetical protein
MLAMTAVLFFEAQMKSSAYPVLPSFMFFARASQSVMGDILIIKNVIEW